MKPNSRARHSEQISWYERALALDPDSVEAQSLLATVLAGGILANTTDTVEADLLRAEDLAARALAASPDCPLPHFAKATLLRAQHRWAEAISEYETVLALNRNWVFAFFALGQCKLFAGSIEETIPLIERAIRISPRDPELVHLLQSRTPEAIIWLEKARNNWPAQSHIRAWLAWTLCGRSTEDPSPVRKHLFCRSAQSWGAGGVTSRSPQVAGSMQAGY